MISTPAVAVTESCPACPFLVVTTMAPLAASEPYSAAAAAPVSTEIDSMSSGLMSAIGSVVPCEPNSVLPSWALVNIGTPSIT